MVQETLQTTKPIELFNHMDSDKASDSVELLPLETIHQYSIDFQVLKLPALCNPKECS